MKNLFETERLIIRKWTRKDAPDLYEYASNSITTKFLLFPTYTNIQTAYERIDYLTEKYSRNDICVDYAIQLKKQNKVIGGIGIVDYKEKNEGCVEIGFVLNSKFEGSGYMTESLTSFFRYIKRIKLAKRIILEHDILNEKSGNVMKRAGMTFEGVLRKAGKNNFHSRHDIALYSILDEEINI